MSEQLSQDQPVNREAVVAAYAPEMVQARDVLANRLIDMREQAKAADAVGELPGRVGFNDYRNGVTILSLGEPSNNVVEGLQQHQAEKALGAMALDLDGVGMPGSESVVVTYGLDAVPQDPSLPTVEQPAIKLDWVDTSGTEIRANTLSFYPDGYTETSSDITRLDDVFSPNAPQQAPEVSPAPRPAEIADIQNAAAKVEGTVARYQTAS